MKEHYNINDLGDPSAATEVCPFYRLSISSFITLCFQEEVTVVGRITLDAETSSGPVKLNEASLTLETSRMMGSGVRIPLRFDPNVRVRQGKQGVGGVGLFPGAIVALRGKNGGGGWFLVTEILCVSSLPRLILGNLKVDLPCSYLRRRRHLKATESLRLTTLHFPCTLPAVHSPPIMMSSTLDGKHCYPRSRRISLLLSY